MNKESLDYYQEKVTAAEQALYPIFGVDSGDEELNYYLILAKKKVSRANRRLKELRREYNKWNILN